MNSNVVFGVIAGAVVWVFAWFLALQIVEGLSESVSEVFAFFMIITSVAVISGALTALWANSR